MNDQQQRFVDRIWDAIDFWDHTLDNEAALDVLAEELHEHGKAVRDTMRQVYSEDLARLTRLLEQRTAALTRTIAAKDAAEARSMRAEALADRWQSATTWDGQPARVDRAFGEALRTELDGSQA